MDSVPNRSWLKNNKKIRRVIMQSYQPNAPFLSE